MKAEGKRDLEAQSRETASGGGLDAVVEGVLPIQPAEDYDAQPWDPESGALHEAGLVKNTLRLQGAGRFLSSPKDREQPWLQLTLERGSRSQEVEGGVGKRSHVNVCSAPRGS